MPPPPTRLVQLRRALRARADAERAPAMQAYMKSTMPYHGVPMPQVRLVAKALFAGHTFTEAQLVSEVRALWHAATHREERYAALMLLRSKAAKPFLHAPLLPLFEELISTGAWWDLVDEVATHLLLPLLQSSSDRAATVKTLRRWSQSDDLWLRRSAIIAQVGAKAATDVELLFELIEPAIDEREFFLRKAIGWALRSLGPWHPRAVESWLDQHAERASGLTRREALKGLEPKRQRSQVH
jgi:3-methyladenine DNA glycosylase AlkD